MRIDEIKREIEVDAPIEVVWKALTSAESLSEWFGDSASVDLRPGGSASFGWSEYDDAFDAVVEVVERPSRFSFRWALQSGASVSDSYSTLVEFELEATTEGTRVRLTESGFSALPEDVAKSALEENKQGWESELDDLKIYLASIRPMV